MLNQVLLAGAVSFGMAEQSPYHVALVVTGEDQGLFAEGVFFIALQQNEVLNDGGQALAGKDVFPQVGGFVALGIGRVALAVVEAFVEG